MAFLDHRETAKKLDVFVLQRAGSDITLPTQSPKSPAFSKPSASHSAGYPPPFAPSAFGSAAICDSENTAAVNPYIR